MQPLEDYIKSETRRQFFTRGKNALGYAALATLLRQSGAGSLIESQAAPLPGALTHFAPKAKRVIYLHMVGGPSQMDLFDYKPKMRDMFDKDLPESIISGQRLTTMTSGQSRLPIAPSKYDFQQHGKSGMWVSEMLPWTSKVVDDMCFIRSMHTEAINHEPGISLMQTGNMVTGHPCMGAWLSYGLGALNSDLPAFVVMVARATNNEQNQAISGRLWSSGYLPGEHAGVQFRAADDAILYLNNPPGVPRDLRRRSLDSLNGLNELNYKLVGDPETHTRIQQFELAFRMQASVPELTDTGSEPDSVLNLYGDQARQPGSLAHSMLMARRMTERGVRFVQIYHNNWDHHGNLAGRMKHQCMDLDQATYGLITDLKMRGLLDETLIIWGGEFGRTTYCQGTLTRENYGRDHHPRCFTMWMAGGGCNAGHIHGETDDFSYNIVRDPVHIRDFHATVLNLIGFDHNRFSFRHQGLEQRLTGVEPSKVIPELMA